MSSCLRTVLTWLLVAALPVQSWAAVAMVNCGPGHHPMAATSVGAGHGAAYHGPIEEALAAGSHAGMSHGGMAHHHASAVVPVALDTEPAAELAAEPDEQALPQLGKCSACAACCVGLGLPSSVTAFDASVSPDALEPGLPRAVAVFLTGGLERPPRPFLA